MTSRGRLGAAGLAIVLGTTAWAQVTERASLNSSGVQGGFHSTSPSVSADGRYVAFISGATNLVPGDTNAMTDVFVRDRQTGTTVRVSTDSFGMQGNNLSHWPSISGDNRYVAFASVATNLAAGDTNGAYDVFVHDLQSGTTERVSVDSGGIQGDGDSSLPSISADGRYVAFSSNATNLVLGDTNGLDDVFVRDRQSGTTERASVDSSGIQLNVGSTDPWISADGGYVAFTSFVGTTGDIFVRDRLSGTTELVSVDSGGTQGNLSSVRPSISSDGFYVTFLSSATNLDPLDTNGFDDVFLRDRLNGTTELVSVDTAGAQGNFACAEPSISADGRYVAFHSLATNFVPGDTNGRLDVFVRDRQTSTTERVSVSSGGRQGNSDSTSASISADGRIVALASFANTLVPADTNGKQDVFVRDRLGAPDFTSLCEPGVAGVIGCPCANPPSGPGRGCDNSAGTGGATMTASGGSCLSSDSLVFTTSGEKPVALSVLMQGNTLVASGAIFGQGVRCVGGALKRLYTKSASGGSITAPSFVAGDLTVHARSAAVGDNILAGSQRWYLVYYRDTTVLGGCLPFSTFNATQSGVVAWSP